MHIQDLTDDELATAFAWADCDAAWARQDLRSHDTRVGFGAAPDEVERRRLCAEISATDERLGALRVERERRAWEREAA